ncbi:hypothetical protein Droror1_Dr00006533 [Drosera rotundifolia]
MTTSLTPFSPDISLSLPSLRFSYHLSKSLLEEEVDQGVIWLVGWNWRMRPVDLAVLGCFRCQGRLSGINLVLAMPVLELGGIEGGRRESSFLGVTQWLVAGMVSVKLVVWGLFGGSVVVQLVVLGNVGVYIVTLEGGTNRIQSWWLAVVLVAGIDGC